MKRVLKGSNVPKPSINYSYASCQPNDADENSIRLSGWLFKVNIIAPGIKMLRYNGENADASR